LYLATLNAVRSAPEGICNGLAGSIIVGDVLYGDLETAIPVLSQAHRGAN
jgi:hypothetical protein